MVSLKRKAVSICCALTLATSLVPVSALAEDGGKTDSSHETVSQEQLLESASIVTEHVDLTDTYDLKDAVVHSVASDGPSISPFSLDGGEISDKVKEAYDFICAKVAAYETEIDVENLGLTSGQLKDAAELVLCNPELWWLRMQYTSSSKLDNAVASERTAVSLTLENLYSNNEINRLKTEVEDNVSEALSWIDTKWTDFEKAQALHDYLVRTCQYSLQVVETGKSEPSFHSAVSALSGDRITVCQGYALAYKLLLSRAGIDAVYVDSDDMKHGWNLVRIGGFWYHVDVTWDDAVCISWEGDLYNEGFDAEVSHAYFLKGDDTFENAVEPQEPHYGWETPFKALSDYALDAGFVYPEYKAPCAWDCLAQGHRSSSPIKEMMREATCTQHGSYDDVVRCTVCRTEISRVSKQTPALGHKFSSYISNHDAQVGKDGTKTAYCFRCRLSDTQPDVGSALPTPKPTPTPSKPAAKPSTPAKPAAKPAVKTPTFKKTKVTKAKSSKKKTLTVTWKKATKNPVAYQVQCATDKKFKKGVKKATLKVSKNLAKKSSLSVTVKKLKAKKTYYVRVRAQYKVAGKTYYGPWVTYAKKVKVK